MTQDVALKSHDTGLLWVKILIKQVDALCLYGPTCNRGLISLTLDWNTDIKSQPHLYRKTFYTHYSVGSYTLNKTVQSSSILMKVVLWQLKSNNVTGFLLKSKLRNWPLRIWMLWIRAQVSCALSILQKPVATVKCPTRFPLEKAHTSTSKTSISSYPAKAGLWTPYKKVDSRIDILCFSSCEYRLSFSALFQYCRTLQWQ